MIRYIVLFVATVVCSFSADAQNCSPNALASTPTSQFVVNTNGTVLDKATGLMWKRCSEGLDGAGCAIGSIVFYDWQNALNQAENSAYAGYKDWRLPNSKELESLVEEKCLGPAINLSVFPNVSSEQYYWSSSPFAYAAGVAWYVYFYRGVSAYLPPQRPVAVRLVRNAQ